MFIIYWIEDFVVNLLLGYTLQVVNVMIDPDQSLDEEVTMSRCETDGKINKDNFPATSAYAQKQVVSLFLFHFGWFIHSETVLKIMKRAGYRPATLEELLALAKDHPELQRQFPIAELGSICLLFGIVKKVVELSTRPDGQRAVKTELFVRKWADEYRFPAVKIVLSTK